MAKCPATSSRLVYRPEIEAPRDQAAYIALSLGGMTTDIPIFAPRSGRSLRSEWGWWMSLFLVVFVVWCAAYNRWTLEAWITPVSYTGDSWGEMAAAKTFASGEVLPILPKYPSSLGAPFVASWNDYPIIEEGVFSWYALFVRLFGVFTGSNLTLLSAHLLAAGSFYFVCRQLRYDRIVSFVAASLFSLSPFAFARSLWHLVLTFYWHVPLGLLVIWWCVGTRAYQDRRKRTFAIAVAVLHGVQYIYYTGIFLQFLFLAALVCLIRRNPWKQVLFPLKVAGVVVATLVAMNFDTFYYRAVNGPNESALVRDHLGMELYALRPIELLLPAVHRLEALQAWTNRAYYSQTMFQGGENNSVYLGLVAIAALGVMAWMFLRAVARGASHEVPPHAWAIGWILAYSTVGGINGLFGTFGMLLFRGTNRYSVVILALALLFLAQELTRLAKKWRYAVACACIPIFLLGLWDQTPHSPSADDIRRIHQQVADDGRIALSLESKLPHAMIFQLPATGYPEVGPVEKMLDYEHFRPYLQSRTLRFSYGSHKGRTRERWQSEVMQFGAAPAVAALEQYGFATILINKKAYPDRATSLLADLQSADRSQILCESDDLIGIALHPVADPLLPAEFDRDWYGLEGAPADNWRWSKGDAKLILYNPRPKPDKIRVSFLAGALQTRQLHVYAAGQRVFGGTLDPARPEQTVELALSLGPGRNEISFRSDKPPTPPGSGDPRPLAFCIRNFKLKR
jgi:phosphoglycerol transferase